MILNQWRIKVLALVLVIYCCILLFFHHLNTKQWFGRSFKCKPKDDDELANLCMRKPTDCIPPLRSFEKRFRAVPRFRLNFCAIEKNMSTVMTAILCFLFDEQRFREMRRNINTELFDRRLCKLENEAFSMAELATRFNQTKQAVIKWLHLAVVRHPLDRFISGFVDKCVAGATWRDHEERCNGCRNNLTCFVHSQFRRMQSFAAGEELNSFDDRHFFPQNWRCQFNEYFRHFNFIRYSPTPSGIKHFFTTLFALLRIQGVSEQSIQFIRNQTARGRAPHSTWQRRQRRKTEAALRENPRLMKLLVKMYYYDFIFFGYPINNEFL